MLKYELDIFHIRRFQEYRCKSDIAIFALWREGNYIIRPLKLLKEYDRSCSYLVICDLTRYIPDHNSTLELVQSHREVTSLNNNIRPTVHWTAQRTDHIYTRLRTNIRLSYRTLSGELTTRSAPDTTYG